MIRPTMEFEDDYELMAAEQAVALTGELKQRADATPDGRVLLFVELAALERGRRFLRHRLQDALNAQATDLEKKRRGWCCPCGGHGRSHGKATWRLITAAGDVTLQRAYFTCRCCGQQVHALDDRLGVDEFVSPQAQRIFCTVGAQWSFQRCAFFLRQIAELVVCDNTVRKVCNRHGGLMRAWQRQAPEACQPFRAAAGAVEFQTGGSGVRRAGAGGGVGDRAR